MIKLFVSLMLCAPLISCNQKVTKNVDATFQEEQVEKETVTTAENYLFKDTIIDNGVAANHVRLYQKEDYNGEYITIIPSLGRGVEDYTETYACNITTLLVEAGYSVVLIQPRGIGKSTGDLTPENSNMEMFSTDLKAAVDALGIKNLHIAGHAFGNRLGRNFTSMYPNYVNKVILMASGGNFEMEPEAQKCLRGSIDMSLNDEERLKFIDCAFFAEGNDASVWLNGWYPKLAAAQIYSANNANTEFYKDAGGKPILLIQATEDFIAPPELAGKALKKDLGEQVTYVEVEHAGHALSSEQPDEVAKQIINFLKNK